MSRVTFFGASSGRAVHSELKRVFAERGAVLGRLFRTCYEARGPGITLLALLFLGACQTVGGPRRPITVTATAVPVDQASEEEEASGSPAGRVGSSGGQGGSSSSGAFS